MKRTLLLLLLTPLLALGLTQPLLATIVFDSASSGAATAATSSVTWTHTLGGGTDRILIVGVVSRGSSVAGATPSGVTFNGVAMTPLSASAASAGSSTFNCSELYYLLDSSLPAAGTYTVLVTFASAQSASNNPQGGSVSLFNVGQSAPTGYSATSGTATAKAIAVAAASSPGAWGVDTVGVGSTSADIQTNASGMVERFAIVQSGGVPNSGAAGSTQIAGSTGAIAMGWTSVSAREVQSVAVVTPDDLVATAPVIATPPASLTVSAGSSAVFTVSATGTAPLSYQWYDNNVAISGATSDTFTLNSAQTTDSGSYTVAVTNSAGSATSAAATLTVNAVVTPPSILTQPDSQIVNVGDSASVSVDATGSGTLVYQWYQNGSAIVGATSPTYSIASAQTANAGSYTVTITNSASTVTSSPAILTVNTPSNVGPVIGVQPASQTVLAGNTANLTVGAIDSGATYQWYLNGQAIPGATDATFTIAAAQPADAGQYTVTITDSNGSVASQAVALTVGTLSDLGRLMNVSVRSNCETGADNLIAGFYIGGTNNDGSTKPLVVRGVGPGLASFGVPNPLADPYLQLFTGAANPQLVAQDDNWNAGDPTLAALSSQVGAFALTSGSLDSALVASLPPGAYTANVTDNDGGTGIALAEVYDGTASFSVTTPHLINVSGRAQVGAGAANLIVGFVIGGSTPDTVLVRGIGPALSAYNVPGVLSDPVLAVHQFVNGVDQGIVASNDGWGGDPALSSAFAQVGAFPLNDPGSADAALLATLEPGIYTANVTGGGGTTGIALAEVYEVGPAPDAPTITTQPAAGAAVAGGSVDLVVAATGIAPLSYQWLYNGAAISGATEPILELDNVQSSDAGAYAVTVSDTAGSVTSAATNLVVDVPAGLSSQPAAETVIAGGTAAFTVTATGTGPFAYQWYLDGAAVSGATGATLTLANVQTANAGDYTVVVSNAVGSSTSDAATLTVSTVTTAPAITTQPLSQTVIAGEGSSTFTVAASGTIPLTYQWSFNGTALTDGTQPDSSTISGSATASLTIANAQNAEAGGYTVTVANTAGSATSTAANLTVSAPGSLVEYDLTGFATLNGGVTGGGVIPTTDPGYVQVTTPLELADAVLSFNKGNGVKVIEIMNDLNLGWNEIGTAIQTMASTPFSEAATPLLHPVLLVTGVSKLNVQGKAGGLTLFSANGATIRHCTLNIKSTSNIIVRNLKFDQMWEWDESTKGDYDRNDWDFMTIGNGGPVTNLWIDHCTFTKSYDGVVDFKAGVQYVTLSWCEYVGDDEATNPNSWVRQQMNALEANMSAYPMYNFLRTNGFSEEDIVTILQGHDKTHLMGQNDLDSGNDTLTGTFHHNWYQNVWDRCVPRLRAGQVHDYNNYDDDTNELAAKNMREARAAAMSVAAQNTLNNTYDFDPPLNGTISTEGGAILVEKNVYIDVLWPLRNNQTDPTNPVYTGKIEALDTIYHMDNSDGSTTDVRGNSTDAGSPLGPFQANVIPFSWNTYTGVPYSYTPDDPAGLLPILQAGAGAGTLTWDKSNWLKTSY